MKKLLSVAFLLVFFTNAIHAQFEIPKTKDVLDMKNRQLIVIINPPDPDVIEKYNNKGKTEIMDEYKQVYGNYNEELKYAVQKFWTFTSGEILYKTWAEVNEMMHDKSQREKYLLMYSLCEDNHYGFDWKIDKNGERIVGTISFFAVAFPGDNPLLHFHIAFPQLIPTATDLAYLVSTINFNLNYVMNHQNNPDLKEMVHENALMLSKKTLLILKSSVSPKVINDIGNYYSCNYKLVEDSVMEQAVLYADPNCAYLIKFGYGNQVNWIVNCADGATLGYTTRGTEDVPYSADQGLRKEFFQDLGSMCGSGMKK